MQYRQYSFRSEGVGAVGGGCETGWRWRGAGLLQLTLGGLVMHTAQTTHALQAVVKRLGPLWVAVKLGAGAGVPAFCNLRLWEAMKCKQHKTSDDEQVGAVGGCREAG